jgi:hypothetical protein
MATTKNKTKSFQVFIYPILFSLYPPLALVANNIYEIQIADAYRSFVLSLGMALLLLLLFRVIFKDWARSALSTTLALFLFFSYGHVYNLLRDVEILGFAVGRHRYLILLWLGIFVAGVFWGIRKMRDQHRYTPFLNTITVIALLIPLFTITSYFVKYPEALSSPPPVDIIWETSSSPNEQTLPDVYYIIMDAYSRDDYLLDAFQFSNTAFLNNLEEMGFYVAKCSQSNYSQTKLSLSTSLNLNYLETFYDKEVEGEINRGASLEKYIKHSQVREILEGLGYQTIAFETGWNFTQITDADLYLSLENKHPESPGLFAPINKFETFLVQSSALSFIIAVFPPLADILLPFLDYPNQEHREMVLFTLDQLEKIPNLSGPKFIFAHIVSPHKPIVFGPNGEKLIKEPAYRKGYPNQIIYLNSRLVPLLEHIIQDSAVPPIIVLQGDHGALAEVGPEGRVAILNAYYFPGGGSQYLYPSITPVNTFRLIFDTYFGMDYELLEDVSRYSTYIDPQNYTIIPNTCEVRTD